MFLIYRPVSRYDEHVHKIVVKLNLIWVVIISCSKCLFELYLADKDVKMKLFAARSMELVVVFNFQNF